MDNCFCFGVFSVLFCRMDEKKGGGGAVSPLICPKHNVTNDMLAEGFESSSTHVVLFFSKRSLPHDGPFFFGAPSFSLYLKKSELFCPSANNSSRKSSSDAFMSSSLGLFAC